MLGSQEKENDLESQIYEDIDTSTICTTLSRENDSMTEEFPCRRLDVHRQCSSDDSWGSGDFESFSSDDEEKNYNKSSSTLKAFFNGGRSLLRDKWRESRSRSRDEVDRKASTSNSIETSETSPTNGERRFSRLFSLRRASSSQSFTNIGATRGSTLPPNIAMSSEKEGTPVPSRMPSLTEESDELNYGGNATFQRRYQPPTLPPAPPGLTPEQFKRRQIVATIVHSENSYVSTLQRIVNDYKKRLEESCPPIMSPNKIATIFHRLPQILHCHNLFRVSLADSIRNWDKEEKLGEVFVASFSKALVLDIYSDFINNFSTAMELAKSEAKRKAAFADFLKVKQISSHDRLSFFGLMVKPVQRFPQFILLLQDLIKHTPPGHHDRMSLQMALTQLESLAELLNERKREAEQIQAFRESLKRLSGKFSIRPLSDGNRYLLRQDDVTLVEFGPLGAISKTKDRRLLLLNDLLLCVAVSSKEGDEYRNSERLQLKWAYPVSDIEVEDMSASPTLSRLLAASGTNGLKSSEVISTVDQLCHEMNTLMQDYETLSRISNLVQSLHGNYEGLSLSGVQQALTSIQRAIQSKDEAMAWVDNCCLHLTVRSTSRGKEEKITFQLESPNSRKDWITELRLAQLALDPRHAPAWELPETEHVPLAKLPLFVTSRTIQRSNTPTEVRCGCFYTLLVPKSVRTAGAPIKTTNQSFVWVITTDGSSSRISTFSIQPAVGPQLKPLGCVDLVETKIIAMEFTPALVQTECETGDKHYGDLVWISTENRRLLLYSARDPESPRQLAGQLLPSAASHIKYHCDQIVMALVNGTLAIYRRNTDLGWDISTPQQIIHVGDDPVSSLLCIGTNIYVGSGKNVSMLDGYGCEVQREFTLHHDQQTTISAMAHAGVGLWLSLKNSSVICLYHTETFRHLQDINIASHVSQVMSEQLRNTPRNIFVTTLMAAKGVLWVGTNVGVTLNIPLPKLQGVPIISGRANVAYHANCGPVTMFLPLVYKPPVRPMSRDTRSVSLQISGESRDSVIQEENETDLSPVVQKRESKLEKQVSDGDLLDRSSNFNTVPKLRHQSSCSPVLTRRDSKERQNYKRMSRTLPRGFGLVPASSFNEFDIYGLYNELMNVKEFENNVTQSSDPLYETLRRSDPDLANMTRVSTLDRRLTLKSVRPRSLDLSTWSVDSRSSAYTNSSGSDEKAENTSITSSTSGTGTASSASSGTMRTIKPSINRSISVRTKRGIDTISKSSDPNTPRTLITLVGGRGYLNLKSSDKDKKSSTASANDAHIVVWEMKL
ncbi:rho guanine nucleotide exchange factor 10-like isoform X3 [Artemia franciscana]|uniref:DH domain-containing protein n=1 Tax=Artemia franciscana TaxID=6661 RepID=A0AA88HFF5_ARTSF|nr:hypothetical protein QYM36_013095 [Artemia franciscana]